MRERRSTTIKKQKVLQQLIETGHNATVSCKNAGIVPSTFYKWQNEDPVFSAKVDDILLGVKKCGIDKIMLKAMTGDDNAWKNKLKAVQMKMNRKTIKKCQYIDNHLVE